ncbi:MAG: aquaporin [Acidimicrobiales bacterium]
MTREVRILLAELLGTMILVIAGCGTAILAGDVVGGTLGIALGFGLGLLVVAYSFGQISGGHVNPAVTVGMIIAGKTEAKDAAWYIIGQVLGAVAGAGIIFLIANDLPGFSTADPVGGGPGFATNGWGDRSPGGFGFLPMVLAETILTGVLMWSVLGTTTRKFSPAASGLAVGMSLTVIHLISIPITNTSVNPARSIGVAIFNSDALAQVAAFIVFPILGALIAAYAWMALYTDDEEAEEPAAA